MERLLSVKEAAEVLRLGHTKFYQLLKRGELRPVRMTRSGRRMMGIRRSDLAAWVTKQSDPVIPVTTNRVKVRSARGKIRSAIRSATRLEISDKLEMDCNQLQSMRNEEPLAAVGENA